MKNKKRKEVSYMAVQGNDNILGAVAYLVGPVTGVALLIIEKKSKFVRFHAMQSTILLGGLWVLSFFIWIIPFLGVILALLLPFVLFVLWLFLMWKAFQGEMYKFPYVGELAEKQLAKLG